MMTRMKVLIVSTLLVACASGVRANDDGESKAKAQKDMMEAMAKYGSLGEPHKRMAKLAGAWKYKSKMWEHEGAKPHESSGTSQFKMILGGRFLQQNFKGKFMGAAFEGLGITGYNNIKETYETVWLDSMGTGMMHGTGTYDREKHILKDSGMGTCPLAKNHEKSYRSDWAFIDGKHMTYTMYGPGFDDDQEFKQLEIVFTR